MCAARVSALPSRVGVVSLRARVGLGPWTGMPDAICTRKKPPGCPSVAVTTLEEQPHQYFVANDLPERSERKVRHENKEYDENCRDELTERPTRNSGN